MRRGVKQLSLFSTFVLLLQAGVPSAAPAQQRRVVSAAEYAHAETFLAPSQTGLVTGGAAATNWLPDDRFWYANGTGTAREIVLVDPAKKTRTICVSGLTNCPGVPASAETAGGGGGRGGRGGGGGGGRGGAPGAGVMSPDGSKSAFIRDYNLWVRDVATGKESALTTDGVKDYGYATDNAGWAASDRAILLWSPDSKKIATSQQDERNVGMFYTVSTTVGHPVMKEWRYPFPGDSVVAMLRRVIIDVAAAKIIPLQLPMEFHRSTLGDNITMNDYKWSPDGSQLALASTSRDHKVTNIRVADAATGAIRNVFEETVPTQFESRTGWQVLWATNEVIWYSQRDNWGQLYLYDLKTGALKNKITTGEGPVSQIARVDEKTRTIWYAALGREAGQDPYFAHFYKIGFDGKNVRSLTPDDGTHAMQLSPDGKYLVDTYSSPDVPPVVGLRDGEGKLVMPLEKADISKLVATGWKPPVRITMKAHDGKTDIYGLMFVPTKLDPSKKYPIINNPYPGPQTGSVGSRTFSAARSDRQALAELGFVVVTIDGMGTPDRSKSFHDAYYGAMGRDNTIPDQMAGMQELARKYPYLDIDRAGIYGHSGGGFITADAMFRFPDFWKVGISESGNHDQRLYEDDWGERYQGLLTRNADGTDSYTVEANQTLAKNLKGHLMLAHGLTDPNVPVTNTEVVIDALIKANKDFDLLLIPNAAHGYGAAANYMMRRRWDYFVRYLLDAEPPKEFEIKR